MALQSSDVNRLIEHGSFEAILEDIAKFWSLEFLPYFVFFIYKNSFGFFYSCVRSKFLSKTLKKKTNIPLVAR
jgi:uncharacterized protein YcsI (UPF0317 family)